ncbi:Crp/Fnr family transcriptional regulator [Gallionella capsiferriformans]|jgi:CRP-like cAMP-binding protein|uniref:Putative transcriptional regulator, Crp/Fnr family n=1 Tax=Gallionella capsiferriformans (strain ES-2) TaxID=395494 RepID=D9SDL8_GALCS|nr:Crp/Fnr family transcriptional regulator [Gallionella capsiferriformans]ADL54775.1 putative transcriptional regulator, Crp/Fnr family [Gallionella capsiferriformans ES-2]
MDWQPLIESQPFLDYVPNELRQVTQYKNMAVGDSIFRIGDSVRNLFCVVKGEVQLIRHDKRGTKIILQRSRGGFFAEASLGSTAYHCDALAVETGILLCFPLAAFRTALDRNSPFRNVWIDQLAREVRKLRAQCERLSLNGAAERIIHYIESEGINDTVTLRQPRKSWASELGLSHESLYRTLKQLSNQGMLHTNGNKISLAPKEDEVPYRISSNDQTCDKPV